MVTGAVDSLCFTRSVCRRNGARARNPLPWIPPIPPGGGLFPITPAPDVKALRPAIPEPFCLKTCLVLLR